MDSRILTLDDFDLRDKRVILRVDINSPIEQTTGALADDNRLRKCLPTIRELAAAGARTVILAHQGDTEDYSSLISLAPHAERLTELLGHAVGFVADLCGPVALERVRSMRGGELLLLFA